MYSDTFFKKREQLAIDSASKIIDFLLSHISISSAVDFGCANGIWLAELLKKGVTEISGIDGPWVNKELLRIPEERFIFHNLSAPLPDSLHKKADLAISLEVAEHLPPERGESFIQELTGTADIVLFSAAIPMQGGTGHLNEQPQSYWNKLFSDNGYTCFDVIRPYFWNDTDVNVVYKQNCLLYVRRGKENAYPFLNNSEPRILDIVHPYLYSRRLSQKNEKVGTIRKIKRKIKKVFLKK